MPDNDIRSIIEIDHYNMVADLVKPGDEILKTLSPKDASLMHMAMGIAGEAGELLDAIKKAVIYCKPLDLTHVIEELGDLEFYITGLRQELNISRATVLRENMAKLGIRYKDGYSDEAAQNRADKLEE